MKQPIQARVFSYVNIKWTMLMNTINRYSSKALWLTAIMLTAFVAGCSNSNSTPPVSDPAALSVVSTNPANSATAVSLNQKIIASFSESMDATTIDTLSFTVQGAGAKVVGAVNLDASTNTAIFVPGSNFADSTVYTATITTAAKSTSGKTLASDYVWTFTSGTVVDTISGGGDSDPAALSIIATNPAYSATDVAINQKIIATFSEAMDTGTLDSTSFTVVGASESALVGTVSLDAANNTATFKPNSDLTASTVYTATITTAATSSGSKALASDYVWTFTSGTAADIDESAPAVLSTDPDSDEIDFAINKNISATFSESLDPTTVNASSFTLTAGTTVVLGAVTYNDNGKVATFNPDSNLAASTLYTATITTDVTDLAGNSLAADKVWTFTSGLDVAPSRLPVDLGTAENFVILTKTGISKTGAAGTAITGDIGVSPAALTYITGFSQTMDASNVFATSTYVTGSIYAADMTPPTPAKMTTAISDMETAYTDAAGRTLPDFTELGAGNVSGMTLEPGLYKWGTNVLITNVGVTIAGSATDVWIFQISGDLIVDNAAVMTLTGGALPENIFWQVAGGAGVSLGTTSQFKGVALAQKAIVVNSGATVNGRLLAQTAVTLDGNAVTQP